MTSNERKILECIWNHGGEVDIRLISDKTGLSSDYSYFLCRALKSAGHLELSGHAFCRLSEKGHKYFEDDRSEEDENIEKAKKDQEVKQDPAVQPRSRTSSLRGRQVDYRASEKREDDIDKKLKELFPNKDEDEEKTDSNPPADDGGAARETEENVLRNDIKHEEEATEKPIVNPIDNSIGLMIKRFVGLLKKSIKVPGLGNVAHGTTKHQ